MYQEPVVCIINIKADVTCLWAVYIHQFDTSAKNWRNTCSSLKLQLSLQNHLIKLSQMFGPAATLNCNRLWPWQTFRNCKVVILKKRERKLYASSYFIISIICFTFVSQLICSTIFISGPEEICSRKLRNTDLIPPIWLEWNIIWILMERLFEIGFDSLFKQA